MAFVACNLPRRFSGLGGKRVCREGGGASISLRVRSPISGLFPLSSSSPVYFHQPELAGLLCFGGFFFYVVSRGRFFY